LNWAIPPSIEDSEAAMAIVIDKLREAKNATRVVLSETRENEYDTEQTLLLQEIAQAYDRILNIEKILSLENLASPTCKFGHAQQRLKELQFLILEVLRKDPLGAYIKVNTMIKAQKRLAIHESEHQDCHLQYLTQTLEPIKAILENTQLVQKAKPLFKKFRAGDRAIYREIFSPVTRPKFMLTRYMLMPPKLGRRIAKYYVGSSLVEIFQVPGSVRYLYHITPVEFELSEEMYKLLDAARKYLFEHRPAEAEVADPEKARLVFTNIGRDIITDLARRMNLVLSAKELEQLVTILTRYTAGFGVLELLLADERVQDIFVNAPIGQNPIYIFHQDFEECETNLIPTKEDAESWATRFRLYSGRPLDEAHPVLDTELLVPGGRARVAAITRTLSPEGLSFAFRRFRDKPWTLPLFLREKFFDPLYAGLMSFIIDGGRALLIAGGRSSGKTSLLGALMLEILRKFRIVVLEDSVTGDSKIIVQRNGKFERTTVGNLIDGLFAKYGFQKIEDREVLNKNPENVKVFSVNEKGKVVLSKVSKFIRHKVKKDIYEIETRTGRKIKVTGDHSLFTIDKSGSLKEIAARLLKRGDYVAVPRLLPMNNKHIEKINLIEHLENLKGTFLVGKSIRNLIKAYEKEIIEIAKTLGYRIAKKHTYPASFGHWKRNGVLPSELVSALIKRFNVKLNPEGVNIKGRGDSRALPVLIDLDEDFLSFLGLWLADGCYDRYSVLISSSDIADECSSLIFRIAERFNIGFRIHHDKHTIVLHSVILKKVMKDVLGLSGNAYTKRIPDWVFNLSKHQVAQFIKGIFSGDGYTTNNEVVITLASKHMVADIQTLLLSFGIVSRTSWRTRKDKTYSCRISSTKFLKIFREEIGFLQEEKMRALSMLSSRVSTHDTTDVIPLPLDTRLQLSTILPNFNKHDYISRQNNFGREKLFTLLSCAEEDEMIIELKSNILSDIFWDEIKSIKKVKTKETYVYDFSVPDCENFVCENILAHNTLELPVVQMRQLGYNIERLKSRSVITHVETELPPDEALRTALRLGDSALVVGEVRSVESVALFEAMRIGALANVVAGTIHGESPAGIFDRIVNDLGVKPTSFKAIDIINICNLLRSPDGLHRYRRVTDVVEVRKHWKENPSDENGFVPLLQYSAKEDRLKPTDTLVYGESEVLNEIAKKSREWHGAWDLIWENILLRAKIKQTIFEFASKLNCPDILEAETTLEANEAFHLISAAVTREVGIPDSKLIYERWLQWFKERLKKSLI
jgi:type IV secretory pathway ATPase VirB11/archaellum biosynthesis ATPase/intein/homing endonuclease